MGAEILKINGSVADAAVTTMLCEGITCKFQIIFKINHQLIILIIFLRRTINWTRWRFLNDNLHQREKPCGMFGCS